MKRLLSMLVIILFIVTYAKAEQAKLSLYPAKVNEDVKKYSLLPIVEEPNDNAALFYEKAANIINKNKTGEEIREWSRMPLDKFPTKQAEHISEKYKEVLQLVERGSKCGKYKPVTGKGLSEKQEYKQIANLLALKSRLEIETGKYKEALKTIQTALGMANHLNEDSDLIFRLAGIAVAANMTRQIELYIEQPDAPSLYWAMQTYPKKLFTIDQDIEAESGEPARLGKRLQRHVTALQCLEALRLNAGSGGKWPEKLEDIKTVDVPKDPISGKAFVYNKNGSIAVLKEPEKLANGKETDVIAYKLDLR